MTHSNAKTPFQRQEPSSLGTSSRRGFPLSLLFLLMVLFAIPLAMLGALASESGESSYEDAGRAGATVFLMLITGVVIGAHHYRRFSGMALGGLIGLVFGALGAPLVGAQAQTTPRLLVMACAGAAVLVVFSYSLRALSKKKPEPGTEAHPLDMPARQDDEHNAAIYHDDAPKDMT